MRRELSELLNEVVRIRIIGLLKFLTLTSVVALVTHVDGWIGAICIIIFCALAPLVYWLIQRGSR